MHFESDALIKADCTGHGFHRRFSLFLAYVNRLEATSFIGYLENCLWKSKNVNTADIPDCPWGQEWGKEELLPP